MWTPEKAARLAELEAGFSGRQMAQPEQAPAAPSMGIGQRLLRGVANTPSHLLNMGQSIGDTLLGTETAPKQLFHVPEAQTTGEAVTDFIGQLPAELASLATGAGAATKGLRMLGAGKRVAPIVGEAAVGAVSGLRQSPEESAMQAGEFGVMGGVMQALGGRSAPVRALLSGTANLGIGAAGQAARGNDLSSPEALKQMAVMGLLPMAQEGLGAAGRRLLRRAEPTPITANIDEVIPPQSGDMLALPGPTVAPSARHWNQLEWPHGQARTFHPSGEPMIPGRPSEMPQDVLGLPGPLRPAQDRLPRLGWPHGEARTFHPSGEPIIADGRRMNADIPNDLVTAPQGEGDVFANAQRRLLRPLAGGESGQMNPYLLGGLGGATGGALLDPEDPLRGASVGAGLALGGMGGARLLRSGAGLAQRLARPIAQQDNMGAIRDPFPKWRSLWIDRSGNPRGTMRDQAHVELLKPGENQKSLLRARVQNDQLYLESTPDSLTPQQKRFAQEFADEHGLSIQTNDRRSSISPPHTTGAAPTMLRSGEPASSGGGGLRPLGKSRSGAVNPMLLAPIAGAGFGALSDTENPGRGALVGAAAGLGIAKGGRFLRGSKITEAADLEMIPGKSTFFGRVARGLEKNLNYNKDELLKALDVRARGEGEHWAKISQKNMEAAGKFAHGKGLTTAQRDAGKVYIASKGDPMDVAALRRSGVPPEFQQYLENAKDAEKQMQGIFMRAESDPEKQNLIANTFGTYQTRQFRYFLDDPNFKLDDALKPAALAEWKQHPMFKNINPDALDEEVLRDFNQHVRELGESGGDYARMGGEGKSRISQTLYKSRKDLDKMPAYRKFLGEVSDPFEAQILTTNKLLQSVTQAKLHGDMLHGALDSNGNRFSMSPKQWQDEIAAAKAAGDTVKLDLLTKRFVKAPDSPGVGGLAGQMVQRQVADHLQFSGHKGIESGNGSWYAALNSIPKAVFTRLNPSAWAHNYGQAVLQGHALGIWNPNRIIKTAKRMASDPSVMEELTRSGVLGGHAGRHEFGQMANRLSESASKGFKDRMKAVMGAINEGYGKPDTWIRATAYLDELEKGTAKGLSREQARLKALEFVNKYSIDYGQVNRLVGRARNTPVVSPFVSYSTETVRIIKNLATDVVTGNDRMMESAGALMSLLALPAMIAYAAKELGLSQDEQKELAKIQDMMPPYMRSRFNATFQKDEKGEFRSFNLGPWMPAGDFVAMAKNILNADVESIATSNPVVSLSGTPLLNMGAEILTGKDLVTGRENRGMDRLINPIKKNVIPTIAPGGYRFEQIKKSMTPNEDGGYGVEEPSGRKITPGNAIAGALGFGTSSVSTKRLLRRVDAQTKQELADAKREATQILKTNAAPQVKEAARQEFEQTKRRILLRRTELLEGVRK